MGCVVGVVDDVVLVVVGGGCGDVVCGVIVG